MPAGESVASVPCGVLFRVFCYVSCLRLALDTEDMEQPSVSAITLEGSDQSTVAHTSAEIGARRAPIVSGAYFRRARATIDARRPVAAAISALLLRQSITDQSR